MPNNKHLTLDNRNFIHTGLNIGLSFRQIALHLDKDPSTISKEVRRHRIPVSTGAVGRVPNRCIHKFSCDIRGLCNDPSCNKSFCLYCKKCNRLCPDFQEEHCPMLFKPPYVCNGCKRMSKCVLSKYFYRAIPADNCYRSNLVSCRSGISFTEDELVYMDTLIAPLVKKKQSIHHICISQADKILCSERTIYKLIDQGILSVRNIDLPRKVRYRLRHHSSVFKVDKQCRTGRTYQEFQKYMEEYPDTPVVQMDSVEGRKGRKVLLTILFTQSELMLIYLREHNTSQSVIDIFDSLDHLLGREAFMNLFPVILTDNGSEFSNPTAIEYDSFGNLRTRIFYCDPSSPHQKPEIERNHEFIRMVLPKGKSFDALSQSDVDLLSMHINSLIRKKLNDRPPTATFSFFHGEPILRKLGLKAIPADEVTLNPTLLLASKEVHKHEKDI
jgi:IS30 family transposase